METTTVRVGDTTEYRLLYPHAPGEPVYVTLAQDSDGRLSLVAEGLEMTDQFVRECARPQPPPRPQDINRRPTPEDLLGMAWWNGLEVPERRAALEAARTFLLRDDISVADAWFVNQVNAVH